MCETYQDVIERIWYDSQGASLLMEAGLLMQAHSGRVFKVAFDKNCAAIPGWASSKITRIGRSEPS